MLDLNIHELNYFCGKAFLTKHKWNVVVGTKKLYRINFMKYTEKPATSRTYTCKIEN